MFSDEHPVPTVEQVKHSELLHKLPSDILKVEAEWRREQLATRLCGVNHRIGY